MRAGIRPDPIFVPGERAVIAYSSEPGLVGLQVEVLEIHYQTWPCGDGYMWTGWGCRLDVTAANGISWWSELSLKKLPPNSPGQWLQEFKPSLLGVPA